MDIGMDNISVEIVVLIIKSYTSACALHCDKVENTTKRRGQHLLCQHHVSKSCYGQASSFKRKKDYTSSSGYLTALTSKKVPA